jgi:phosphinothricin acetyltransferase
MGFLEIGVYSQVGRKFGKYWDVLWMERALKDREFGSSR